MTRGALSEIFSSFQGEGLLVGQRHLFVRMSGCNLRCAYCDTPGSLEREPEYTLWLPGETRRGPNPISPEDLSRFVGLFFASDPAIDAVSLTGGEPLMQAEFLRAWLSAARLPVPVMLETSGVLPEALAEVVDLVDVISMDLKLPSNTGEPEFWSRHEEFARLASSRTLYAKILIDEHSDPSEVEKAAGLLAAVAPDTPVFLQPISGADGRPTVSQACLSQFHALARRNLRDVRVVPQIHKLLGVQ